MKEFFEGLFQYNKLINDKMIGVIINNRQSITSKAVELLSHVLLVHRLWNNRILEKEMPSSTWEQLNMDSVHEVNSELNLESYRILKEIPLENLISYSNSKGDTYNNRLSGVLYQIINHSNYHRAQINTQLRACGIEPLITDYIFYKR